jgi:hypothetical protein
MHSSKLSKYATISLPPTQNNSIQRRLVVMAFANKHFGFVNIIQNGLVRNAISTKG